MKTTVIAAAVLTLILGAQGSAAQQPTQQMPQRVQAMDSQRMRMMDSQGMRMMDSMDARLDSLVTKMNRASGNAKVTAMAQVINELVAQRRTMRAHMREMMQSHSGHAQHHPEK